MKVCPTCKETYKDDDINFCLADGTTLIKKKNGAKAKTPSHSRVNEVLAIILMVVAFLMLLALVTSSPSDPSLFTAAPPAQKAQNWIGPIGANFAALLFNLIGLAAYVFPFLVGFFAWRIFRSDELRPPAGRIVGLFLLLLSAAALLWMVGSPQGVINKFYYEMLAGLLGKIGTGIFLFASLVVSMILLTNLTFAGFFSHLSIAWTNLRIRINDWRSKHGADPEVESQRAKERSEKRREIRKGRTGDLPSTIIAGETIAVGNLTVPDIIPAGGTVSGPKPSEDLIPPTIAVAETSGVDEISSGEIHEPELPIGAIPISPVRHTGELDDESDSADDDVVDQPTADSTQNFENYVLPGTHFLTQPSPPIEQKEAELRALAADLSEKTKEFNVTGRVVHISQGPVVTTFEFKPDPGVKYSRVTGLVDDLCLALKAESIRIDRIPGKAFVGIEVPNSQRENIFLREVIESRKFKESQSKLTIALGKTIDGLNYVADLAKMPHLLIAGATGAGKSVGVNSLVVSILYKARPDEVKFIMVDPKRLELGLYADIPHLATPIITDPKRAAVSLRWAVSEMERRYRDLAGYGVRNIDGFNAKVRQMQIDDQLDDNGNEYKTLPYIVIIIDELADLMMVSGKDVEEAITRLAQMARAVGIHLVLATQRPSVDVITGLIKANFPSRISFRVSSKVDSRTIIDANGAENLLGKGDMLFLPPGNSQLVRVHGAYVDEKEIQRIVEFIKSQGKPEYDTTITKTEEELDDSGELPGRRDPLFTDALRTVVHAKRASTSLLQRHLRIGYGRAAAILDAMVKEGYIGEMDGSTRARPILQKAYEDLQDLEEMNAV
jgi:S-DNA-T family DNA segregation ATPase FtsK/SpoIIIE